MELRLGDVIDDHCIKCRRLTNHSVVSIVEGQVAKVRCRSCYHEHAYLHEIAPPSRKDIKKAELAAKAEAEAAAAKSADGAEPAEPAEVTPEPVEAAAAPAAAKAAKGRARKA